MVVVVEVEVVVVVVIIIIINQNISLQQVMMQVLRHYSLLFALRLV